MSKHWAAGRHRWLVSALLGPPTIAVALAVGPAGVGTPVRAAIGAAAADAAEGAMAPVDGILDRPAVDVAVIDPAAGADRASLVVLRPPDPTAGTAVELLTADGRGAWSVADRKVLVDRLPANPATEPMSGYLLRLGTDPRFVAALPGPTGALRLVRFDVRGAEIRVGAFVTPPMPLEGAGSADVDGDGSVEVVTVSRASPSDALPGGVRCESVIRVLDGPTLAERVRHVAPGVRIGPVALAPLDDRGGTDLAATVVAPCEAGPAIAPGDLVGIGLVDGVLIGHAPLSPASDAPAGPLPVQLRPGAPAVVIAADGDRTTVVDPARGWSKADLFSWPARVVGIGPVADGAATIAAVDLDRSGRPRNLAIRRLQEGANDPPRSVLGTRLGNDFHGATWRSWRDALRPVGGAPRWPLGWSGDVDADGCPELVVPQVVLPCATAPDAEPRLGPMWVATRPVAVLPGDERHLLVAASLAWDPGVGFLPPTPLSTADATGGWRTGPSVPFALGELRADELTYFPQFPIPTPTVDPRTGLTPLDAAIAGRTGNRLLVRTARVDPSVTAIPTLPFDGDEPGADTTAFVTRTPVRAGGLSGVDDLATHVTLEPDPAAVVGDPTARAWLVAVMALNDWGMVSQPQYGIVRLDLVGPHLDVRAPAVSAPWPFSAPIEGTTEPRATVQLVGAGEERANRAGGFSFRIGLAPWPQDYEFRAVDSEGNVTSRTVSIMGGLDVRRLPWQLLLTLGVLGAIAAATLRGSRDGRKASVARTPVVGTLVPAFALDDPPLPTIEDLEPTGPA